MTALIRSTCAQVTLLAPDPFVRRRGRRWRTCLLTGLTIAAVLMRPAIVAAQDAAAGGGESPVAAQAGVPGLERPFGVRGYASFDVTRMTASRTFDAVFGTSDLSSFGAGGEVLRVWRRVFARVGFSRLVHDGIRVVVLDDEVTPVGVATRVRMMPLEIAGGWRFAPAGRLVPYVGGGLVRIAYEETTDVDAAADDTSEAFMGSLVFAGVDVQLAGPVGFGAELQHRRLPNAIGDAGASAAFREDDLGGLTIRLWIGVGR
jgi:hypothetical protein